MHTINLRSENDELALKKLSQKPLIHPSSTVINSRFGDYTEVEANSFCNEISLGNYSYLSTSVRTIWCDIGNFTSIASHCVINPGNHPYQRVTQSHCTYRRKMYGFSETDDDAFFQWRKSQKAIIGHDVWLGHGAMIMPGAVVSTGAVVAAGAVVVKGRKVNPYEIVAGVPAKPVKMRFPVEVVDQLLEIGYWHWSREKLEQAFEDFNNVNAFVEKYRTSGRRSG